MPLKTRADKVIKLGIDATNIRIGGGITHLNRVLSEWVRSPCLEVVIFGSMQTLDRLPDGANIEKVSHGWHNKGLAFRTLWQVFYLRKALEASDCNVLLVPGGSCFCGFSPKILMSQNMLPFEWLETKRYFPRPLFFKWIALRICQLWSFRNADGVIFLSEFAASHIGPKLKGRNVQRSVIPHGIDDSFFNVGACRQFDLKSGMALRITYVSSIDIYKHQDFVFDSVIELKRLIERPIELNFVGDIRSTVMYEQLQRRLKSNDEDFSWVKFSVVDQYSKMADVYQHCDLGIFASTCENLPNILMEMMASAVPVVCVNKRPMVDLLRGYGALYEHGDSAGFVAKLCELAESEAKREEIGRSLFLAAKRYSWRVCAVDTFEFVAKLAPAVGK